MVFLGLIFVVFILSFLSVLKSFNEDEDERDCDPSNVTTGTVTPTFKIVIKK